MKIQIVDDQDELIGVKERSQIDYHTDIYRVSALWLTNLKGHVLLAKRSAIKDKDPGKWGPAVAGTVDEGETYDINIYKEAKEEIGLEGVRFTKGPKMHVKYPRKYFCQWYFATLDRTIDSFVTKEDEVEALEWVDTEIFKQDLKINPDKYLPTMSNTISELGI